VTALVRGAGYEEVDLIGPCFDPGEGERQKAAGGLGVLVGRCMEMQTTIHLPALAAQNVTPDLVRALAGPFRPALNLAAEILSSTRLTALLDGPEGADLRQALETAQGEIGALRISFMAGHPLEDDEGWKLAGAYVHMLRRAVGRKARIRVSIITFIPRAYTPYARAPLPDAETLRAKAHTLRKAVSRVGGTLSFADPDMAVIEGVIARGDRRMGAVLRYAWETGGYLETGRDNFSFERWRTAIVRAGLDMTHLACAIADDGPLPWEHLAPA
jgi:hypothetical protein